MAKLDLLALELEDFSTGMEGKKIIVYGVNDTGKTKQLAKLEKPLLLMTESGGSAVRCLKQAVTTWAKFKEITASLTKESTLEDMQAKFQTILIDTAENLVSLAERAICDEEGVRDLSEITGKKNGYTLARKDFEQQINKLTSLGYTVVFIAHEEIVEMEDEVTGEPYNFVQPKGTGNVKSSMRMLRDLCDFCIYLKPNGIDPTTYETIPSTAICRRTKKVFARSRFAIQTFIEPFTAQGLIDAVNLAVEKSAEEEGAGVEAFKVTREDYTVQDYVDLLKPYMTQLFAICKEEALSLVTAQIGEGRKISDCTEAELKSLEVLYNNIVSLAMIKGIEI